MGNGWIKLHRKLLENPIFKNERYLKLWVYILLRANHKPDKIMWNGGILDIKAGQFVTGRNAISEELKVPASTVERILKYLENEHQIGQQKTSKFRIISILNWKQYQNMDSKTDNKRTASGQQTDTNKNDKKVKNDKKEPAQSAGEPGKEKFTTLGAEVIKAFEEIDPKNKRYYGNTTQRKSADFLISEYGFEEVKKRISVLPRTNKLSYFPTITTPTQLLDKWVQLQDAVERKRGEVKKVQEII